MSHHRQPSRRRCNGIIEVWVLPPLPPYLKFKCTYRGNWSRFFSFYEELWPDVGGRAAISVYRSFFSSMTALPGFIYSYRCLQEYNFGRQLFTCSVRTFRPPLFHGALAFMFFFILSVFPFPHLPLCLRSSVKKRENGSTGWSPWRRSPS